ncbi:RICIN domain-containing protein [Streptomyces sp. NPDC059171]|uniref:RICIN domain-containing protein n=1 Tax=Streptomyces sp. NPDC059171 TaxID=3346755 RepID=UPI00369A3007
MGTSRPRSPFSARYLLTAATALVLTGGGLTAAHSLTARDAASGPPAPAALSGSATAEVPQLAQRAAHFGRTEVAGRTGDQQARAAHRICDDGARWLRVRFDALELRGTNTVTLRGSRGGEQTLTAGAGAGRAFHTRAFEGDCVTVEPALTTPGSHFTVDAYQSGERPRAADTVTLAAAGDICGTACNQTAEVVAAMAPAAVITAGDNAYDSGKLSEFKGSYDRYWGRFNSLVHPTPGNHEYRTSGASGYFDYYGGKNVETGGKGKGYYSFDVGDWHLVALNSNVSMSTGSTQEKWLRADLAASGKPCTLAYWHHARFSSGDHGDTSGASPLYKALTDYKADVVVTGHDHHYERFAPSMADGRKDTANGVRPFVIGTGGRALYSSTGRSAATSEKFDNKTFGVGRFDLSSTGYSFTFKPVAGRTFTDSVSGACHAKGDGGPGPTPTPTPTPTPAPGPIVSGRTYKIDNVNSGLALDKPTNGEHLVQWDGGAYVNQRFTLTGDADSGYQMKIKSSGRCVAVASTADGAAAVDATCSDEPGQRWRVTADGSAFRLTSVHSGMCMDVSGSSTTRGARIVQNGCDSRASQRWVPTAAS